MRCLAVPHWALLILVGKLRSSPTPLSRQQVWCWERSAYKTQSPLGMDQVLRLGPVVVRKTWQKPDGSHVKDPVVHVGRWELAATFRKRKAGTVEWLDPALVLRVVCGAH